MYSNSTFTPKDPKFEHLGAVGTEVVGSAVGFLTGCGADGLIDYDSQTIPTS